MTESSEQVAWRMYRELSAPDRRLVDHWRNLGNDLVTSLLNSGALGSSQRRHPTSASASHEMSYIDAADRWPVGSVARRRRRAAEHEAVHSIVGQQLGMSVAGAEIDDEGNGKTLIRAEGSVVNQAAMLIAPAVWCDHRLDIFPAGDTGGCSEDFKTLILELGADDWTIRRARALANQLLRTHRRQILELADELERNGAVRFAE